MLLALLISIAVLFTGCIGGYKIGGKVITQRSSEEMDVYSKLAQNLVTMMGGESAEHLNSLSATKEITFEKEWQQWQDYIATYGPFQDFSVGSAWKYGSDTVVVATAQFGDTHICFDSRWTSRNKLIEVCMYRYPQEEEAEHQIPEGVIEKDIVLNEGTGYELPGKITMPADAAEGSLPAALLIVGTGAFDMDHTAGVTHSYRDLAWDLAEQEVEAQKKSIESQIESVDDYIEYVESYYEEMLSNLKTMEQWDTLAHLDYIIRYIPDRGSLLFDSYEAFPDLIDEILLYVISCGKCLEVNTAGYKYGLGQPNPAPSILRRYYALGGRRITIGADAHAPEHIAIGFDEVRKFLLSIGYERYTVFRSRVPEELPL